MKQRQYQPFWDGRFWDGRPVVVKLEDWSDFLAMNRVRVVRARWPEGQPSPVVEVARDERRD